MRRIAIVVLGLALFSLAVADSASARPRGLPGLFGVLTRPLGAILGNPGRMSRRAYHRRSAAARTRARAPVAAETRPAPATQAAPRSAAAPAAVAAGAAAGAAGV